MGWVFVAAMVFGVGAIAVITEHMQKMAKIRVEQHAHGSREVMDAVESLRREVADLRETTTRYDMSFDMALQRMESRVAKLEAEHQNRLGAGR